MASVQGCESELPVVVVVVADPSTSVSEHLTDWTLAHLSVNVARRVQ